MENNYQMTFAESQAYISERGLDIPLHDDEVFCDEREITRTVGNVLKWADDHQEPIPMSESFNAACIVCKNGLRKGYNIEQMAHYAFVQGMMFQVTKNEPELIEE